VVLVLFLSHNDYITPWSPIKPLESIQHWLLGMRTISPIEREVNRIPFEIDEETKDIIGIARTIDLIWLKLCVSTNEKNCLHALANREPTVR